MNLSELIIWSTQMQTNKEFSRRLTPDVKTGLPNNGDIAVCNNLLTEIRKRALLVSECTRKAEKYMSNITEYLAILDKRGVSFPSIENISQESDGIDTQSQEKYALPENLAPPRALPIKNEKMPARRKS